MESARFGGLPLTAIVVSTLERPAAVQTKPAVASVEVHPESRSQELLDFCREQVPLLCTLTGSSVPHLHNLPALQRTICVLARLPVLTTAAGT